MQIYVDKIHPNTELKDKSFMEVRVNFWEDETAPYRSAEVTVFIEKSSLTLSEIEIQTIEKARAFLKLAADAHSS